MAVRVVGAENSSSCKYHIMIGVTKTIFILPVILLLSQSIQKVHSFAISSSNSPKRKKVSNQGKSAGGFAKKDDGKFIYVIFILSYITMQL